MKLDLRALGGRVKYPREINVRDRQRPNRYGKRTINRYWRSMDDVILQNCQGKIVSRPQVVACLVRSGFPVKDARRYTLRTDLLVRINQNDNRVNMFRIARRM